MGKAPSIVVAIAAVGGAVALFLVPPPKGPPPGPTVTDLRPIAEALNGKLREAARTAKSRAGSIGTLPSMAPVVATDTATVADFASDVREFRVQPDETIEIGQIKDKGPPISLWKSPRDSLAHPAIDKAGASITSDGKQLIISFVEDIRPVDNDQGVVRGTVAVSEVVDVSDMAGLLAALGTPAEITLGDSRVAGVDVPPTAKSVRTELDSDAAKGVTIVAVLKPAVTGSRLPFEAGGGALALVGLAAAAFLWVRAGRQQLGGGGNLGNADTQLGGQPLTPAGGVLASRTGSQPNLNARVGSQPNVNARTGSQPGQYGQQSSTIGQVIATGGRPSPSVMSGPGSQFGRYSLIKRIGSGGMADVYLARTSGEAGFEKLFALKIMHEQLARQRPDAVEHFLDEARTVARLTHPSIVQIADLGREGDNFFIAMEYIDGCDLEQLRQRATDRRVKIPVRVAIAILRKICDGLHAAHTAMAADGRTLDLVHRDVKSQNVLVSRNGAVKVTDFGIAKSSDTIHKTVIGQVKGTAAYMAPEQRTGQAIDRRADVYGVGTIGYELLSGQIIDLDLANLAHLGKEGWPHLQALSKIRTDLPPEIDDVIFHALKFEKADRYPDCASFETALENLANNYSLVMSDKALAQWIESEFVAYKATLAKEEEKNGQTAG